MKEIEIVIVDYHRKGQAAEMAHSCEEAFTTLGISSTIHILRPPESKTPLNEFPEHTQFWNLDRNHGAQQRYSLAGEIKAPWSLYLDNDLVPTTKGITKLVEAARTHGDNYSCYGWLGHNISNVRGGHIYACGIDGLEVDYILRAYLFQSEHVRTAVLDFPIFHWEDDLNMQIKIQQRKNRPSWVVNHENNFVDLGGNEETAHYRQPGHFDRRQEMVVNATSYLANPVR